MNWKKVGILCAVATTAMLRAATPIAVWTDFTGLTAETPLAPEFSSTQDSVNGSGWRFQLNGGSVGDDGTLSTGTTAAPRIDFGGTINVGYSSANHPLTVLLALRGVSASPLEKPLMHVGNGSAGCGVALKTFDAGAGTATLTGCWGNTAWQNGTAANRVFPQMDDLTGDGVVYLALSLCPDASSWTATAQIKLGTPTPDWTSITDLRGSGVSATGINFGNFVNATSGGMDFTLCGVAVYAGRPDYLSPDVLTPVYTQASASSTSKFHEGPWNVGSVADPDTVVASADTAKWVGFAKNQQEFAIPGRILRFAPGVGTAHGLDATFSPFSLGGLIVEPGATGWALVSATESQRYTELGDVLAQTAESAVVIHEDFTIDRNDTRTAADGGKDDTSFYGPVSVQIDPENTFTIVQEAIVTGQSTVTLSGGGTLACGTKLTVAGTLAIADGTVDGDVVLDGGTLDLRGVDCTLDSLTGSGSVVSSTSVVLTVPSLNLETIQVGENITLAVSDTLALPSTPKTVTLASLPETIDCSRMGDWVSGYYPVNYPDGTDVEAWQDVTLAGVPSNVEAAFSATSLTLWVKDTDNFIVWPVGDSITEGTGQTDANAPTYRSALVSMMKAAGMTPRTVGARYYKYAGIDDENCRNFTAYYGARMKTMNNSTGYLQGIENFFEQAGYPDAVTIMVGTNDVSDAGVTVAACFERWKLLIQKMVALRPNTYIIVAPIIRVKTTYGGNYNYATAMSRTEEYNASISALFSTTTSTISVDGNDVTCTLGTLNAAGEEAFGSGARVIMASMFDAVPGDEYFADTVHPNQAGYNRMAAVWLEAIKTLRGAKGGLKDALSIVEAYQTAGAMDSLTAVFNHQLTAAQVAAITVDGVAPASATLSDDGRRVTLALASAKTHGSTATIALGALSKTVDIAGSSASERVDASLLEGYALVKALDVPNQGKFNTAEKVAAAFADAGSGITTFDRVGYYVTQARADGALRYLWVSMDSPFSSVDQLGLPQSPLRTKVGNLRVSTNVPGVDEVTEDGVEGLIQFTHTNVSAGNYDNNAPAGLANVFDWNDAFGSTNYGYGVMQVFRLYPDGRNEMPASTLFGYSHWALDNSDYDEMQIGDLSYHFPYSYSTASRQTSVSGIFTTSYPNLNTTAWSVKRIEVWAHSAEPVTRTWNGTATDWDTTNAAAWAEGGRYINGNLSDVVFPNLGMKQVNVTSAVTPRSMTIQGGMYGFSGSAITPEDGTISIANGTTLVQFSGSTLAPDVSLDIGTNVNVVHSASAARNYVGTFGTGSTLTVTSSGNINATGSTFGLNGLSSLTFDGSGWYALPALNLAGTALANKQSDGLVLTNLGDYNVGSLSGTKGFRIDWGDKEGDLSRTLVVNQTANTTYSAATILTTTANYPARILNLTVKGSGDAKTLTLTGSHTCTDGGTEHVGTLTVDATGSVKLTGSWAGPAVVSGELYGCGALGAGVTFSGTPTLTMVEDQTLSVTGAVAGDGMVALVLPDGVTLAVGESLAVLSATGDIDASIFAPSAEGLTCYVEGTTLYVANRVNIDTGDDLPSEAVDKITEAIREAAGGAAVTEVSEIAVTTAAGVTAAPVADVLALFDGVIGIEVEGTTATATVEYYFGVTGVTYDGSNITVRAEVRSSEGNDPAFVDGVTVSLVDAETGDPVALTSSSVSGNVATLVFPIPESGRLNFKAKVSKD